MEARGAGAIDPIGLLGLLSPVGFLLQAASNQQPAGEVEHMCLRSGKGKGRRRKRGKEDEEDKGKFNRRCFQRSVFKSAGRYSCPPLIFLSFYDFSPYILPHFSLGDIARHDMVY